MAFLGIMHLNKPEYFQRVKKNVDSFRNAGYSIFYESVLTNPNLDSLSKLEVQRKFRKVSGFHLTTYLDTLNKSVSHFQIKNMVNQTKENTGINTKFDHRADLSLDSLVMLYERDKGKIHLDDCDFKTDLNSKYSCYKTDHNNLNYLILTLRDQHLAKEIINFKNDKILVIYGDRHEFGLKNRLMEIDSLWHYSKMTK